jgi:hypothetical protein
MNPLETYLNRATRGIWGKKKLEVKAELRGSIEARAWKLECLGFTPELALETACCTSTRLIECSSSSKHRSRLSKTE